MKYDFKPGAWNMDGLTHAFSTRFDPMPEFVQAQDCIKNAPTTVCVEGGYAYISLVTKEKLAPGVKISCRCAFEKAAAPLFVLAKDLTEKDGLLYYGDYLEAVIWKNGVNAWNLWTDENGTVQIRNLMELKMPVEQETIHDFSLEIKKDRFVITLDGRTVSLYCGDIYDSFHLGITGCEGLCRFYDMEISEISPY